MTPKPFFRPAPKTPILGHQITTRCTPAGRRYYKLSEVLRALNASQKAAKQAKQGRLREFCLRLDEGQQTSWYVAEEGLGTLLHKFGDTRPPVPSWDRLEGMTQANYHTLRVLLSLTLKMQN